MAKKNAVDELAQSIVSNIQKYAENTVNKAQYDQSYYSSIYGVNQEFISEVDKKVSDELIKTYKIPENVEEGLPYYYTVKLKDQFYVVQSPNNYGLYQDVMVYIPNGNWSRMYIDSNHTTENRNGVGEDLGNGNERFNDYEWNAVSGGKYNHVEGYGNAIVDGEYSHAEGSYNIVSGGQRNSVSGYGNTVNGGWDNSVSGYTNTAEVSSCSIISGQNNSVSRLSRSIVIGDNNEISNGSDSIWSGDNHSNNNHVNSSIVTGHNNKVSGRNHVVGGSSNNVEGNGNIVVGDNLICNTNNSAIFGRFNKADNMPFVIGNGDKGNRSDLLTLDAEGDLTIIGKLNAAKGVNLNANIKDITPTQYPLPYEDSIGYMIECSSTYMCYNIHGSFSIFRKEDDALRGDILFSFNALTVTKSYNERMMIPIHGYSELRNEIGFAILTCRGWETNGRTFIGFRISDIIYSKSSPYDLVNSFFDTYRINPLAIHYAQVIDTDPSEGSDINDTNS